MKAKVFIEVSGGSIQTLITSSPDIEVIIVDYDNLEQSDTPNVDLHDACEPTEPDCISPMIHHALTGTDSEALREILKEKNF